MHVALLIILLFNMAEIGGCCACYCYEGTGFKPV